MTNIYMRTKTHVMLVGTMYYANMLCITDIPKANNILLKLPSLTHFRNRWNLHQRPICRNKDINYWKNVNSSVNSYKIDVWYGVHAEYLREYCCIKCNLLNILQTIYQFESQQLQLPLENWKPELSFQRISIFNY